MDMINWPGGTWQTTLQITLTILAIYLAALWITLIFWTYRDIRQRSRDPIVQTVAVLLVLVFFLPGHWIYLILRPRYTLSELYERSLEEEALLQDLEDQRACPSCNRRIEDEFLLCPFCRTSLKEPCRSCSKPLNRAWVACPFCGIDKPSTARPPRKVQQPASQPAAQPAAAAAGQGRGQGRQRRKAASNSTGAKSGTAATQAEGNGQGNTGPRKPAAPPRVEESGMIDATHE
ncbi:MAG: zinc ribbon domain-containing protein [Dehalococcoidia bacterium]|nr:zinc ribbon domain-containing protein [Dehalococcoidia bacterium]